MIYTNGSHVFGRVLNFNDKKVRLANIDGCTYIIKKSSNQEIRNLLLATDFLHEKKRFISGGIRVEIAKIMRIEGEDLYLHFCPGINLESGLKFSNKNQRFFLLNIIAQAFRWAAGHGFLWGDFAPRNMVYNPHSSTLFLFDFEKELRLLDCSQDTLEFSSFARSYLYEEFSCFLSYQERARIIIPIIRNRLPGKIATIEILSRRKKKLLSLYFGSKHFYSSSEVQFIEDLMVDIATPIMVKRRIIYPMKYWEKIKTLGGYDEYAKHVRQYRCFRRQYQRFCYLQNAFE